LDQTRTAPVAAPARHARPDFPHGRLPILAMVVTAAALLLVVLASIGVHIPYGLFYRLPLYGVFQPVASPWALTVVPAGALLAFLAWYATTSTRPRTPVALALLVFGGVVTAVSIALVRGHRYDLVRGVSTAPGARYLTSDVHLVDQFGIRGFVEHYTALFPLMHVYNARTHPPGLILLLHTIMSVVGSAHLLRVSTVMAVIAMSGAVAAWLMGREGAGPRSGMTAAILFVASPGPLVMTYTSVDAVIAVPLALGAALVMVAVHRDDLRWAAAGGAVLGVAALLTYAVAFVALAATIAIAIEAGGWRRAVRLLGGTAAGGVAVLLLAWLTLGFNLLTTYRATPNVSNARYDPYWIIGSPAAVLIFAGIPVAALGLVGLVRPPSGTRRAVLPLTLVVIMLVWVNLPPSVTGLRPGETERTWAFLYPMLAAAAAAVVTRWLDRASPARRGTAIATLVVIGVAQTVLIQSLWDTLF
jgi:hypothetical protein